MLTFSFSFALLFSFAAALAEAVQMKKFTHSLQNKP